LEGLDLSSKNWRKREIIPTLLLLVPACSCWTAADEAITDRLTKAQG